MLGTVAGAKTAPFDIIVRGTASTCTIEVDRRKVTTDELVRIAHDKAKSGHRVHLVSDGEDTPYRCVGSVIYALQVAGFKDIGFAAQPPPASLPPRAF